MECFCWVFLRLQAHLSVKILCEVAGLTMWVCMCVYMCVLSSFSYIRLFVTLWTVACQAAQSMEFSRQEYWSEFPCSSPGALPDPGLNLQLLLALAGGFFTNSATWEAPVYCTHSINLC